MKKFLKDYKAGKIDLETILEKIKNLPYKDLGFAKIDTHREIRKGFPETIFCKGKTQEQVISILTHMMKHNNNILLTKATKSLYNAIKKLYPIAKYNEQAKVIAIQQYNQKPKKGNILVLSAGTSDIPAAEEAVVTA